jgi:hypothetical protein
MAPQSGMCLRSTKVVLVVIGEVQLPKCIGHVAGVLVGCSVAGADGSSKQAVAVELQQAWSLGDTE